MQTLILVAIAGLAAWFWLLSSAGVLAVRRQSADDGIGMGAWAGLLALAVHGLVDARQAVDGWTKVFAFLEKHLAG